MKPVAFLMYGSERRHRDRIGELSKYLSGIGCDVTTVPGGTNSWKTLWLLWKVVRSIRPDQLLLLVYNGHGLRGKWETGISYTHLAFVLRWLNGNLMIVNDTCYGFHLLHVIRKFRSADTTGFISAWDSDDVSYGGPLRDILRFWPQGMRVEDEVSGQIYSSEDGDIEVPVQIRWGTQYDHYFFPD